MKIGSEYY